MKFGIGLIPQDNIDETVQHVKLAEESGFEYAWINDKPDIDIYKLFRNILLETDTIKIGPGVTNPYIRKPGKLSLELMNLNKMSENRMILGIGAGNKSQMDNLNITWDKPLTTLKRTINVINDMNQQNPHHKIPVYVESSSPKLLDISTKIADGALINASNPKEFREIKIPSEFDMVSYSTTSVDRDANTARNAARIAVAFAIAGTAPHILERHEISEKIQNDIYLSLSKGAIGKAIRLISEDFIDEFSIAGTPDDIPDKIKSLEKVGVTQFVCGPPIGKNISESVQLFGEIISSY